MAYNIIYKKSVHRDLKKLSKPEAKRILDLVEKELIRQALENTKGNQTKAAKLLTLTRDALRYRMQKFGLLEKA